ncbi:MAG: hypothetical protein FWD46_07235 [Cystobacterineae bacterium]|nr:hypothetical protein [Cystobacterineae bacterium]
MRRELIYVGMVWAGLASAQGSRVYECKKRCSEVQAPCIRVCKEQLKKADHPHCAPGCKKAVETCKTDCEKPTK